MLRSTRQYVEAIAQMTGMVRATRQYIEVLAYAPLEVTQRLLLHEVVTAEGPLNHWASQTIEFEEEILYLQDVIDYIPVEQEIEFTQETEILGLFRFVYDVLTLADTHDVRRPWYVSSSQYLNFDGYGESRYGTRHITVEETIALEELIRKALGVYRVSQGLNFTQALARMLLDPDVLTFVQSVTGGKGKTVSQTLALFQTIVHKALLSRSITVSLAIIQAMTYWINSVCVTKQFNTFSGEGGTSLASFALPIQQFTTGSLTLAYPVSGAIDSITLRTPELDNIERLSYDRVVAETRGGQRIIFSDPDWPKISTLSFTVIGMETAEPLIEFFTNYVGEEILLTDWEGVGWVGIVTTPDAEIVHDGKRGYSVTFEFEGQRIDSHAPGGTLSFSQSVTVTVA